MKTINKVHHSLRPLASPDVLLRRPPLRTALSAMKMTHEEYVEKKRRRVGELARAMLAGGIPYLDGSIELASLRHEIDLPGDPDLMIFVAVASEVDDLPLGSARQHWSVKALERHEPAIQEATKWAKETSLAQCKALAERFNA